MIKQSRSITIEGQNFYNRQSYKIGTRITTAQVAHRVGYYDKKSKCMFYDQELNYDAWIWLVNVVREKFNYSPQDASRYVNNIYQTKLRGQEGSKFGYLNKYIVILRDTCGKWFSVIPSMMVV